MSDQEMRPWEGMIGAMGACIVLSAKTGLPEGNKTLLIDFAQSRLSLVTADHKPLELDWEEGGFLEEIKGSASVGVMEPPAPGTQEPVFYYAFVKLVAAPTREA